MSKTVKFSTFSSFSLAGESVLGWTSMQLQTGRWANPCSTLACTNSNVSLFLAAHFLPILTTHQLKNGLQLLLHIFQILAPFSMCGQAYKNEKLDSIDLNRQAQNSRIVITCHFALFN